MDENAEPGDVRVVRYLKLYASQGGGTPSPFKPGDTLPPLSLVDVSIDSKVFEPGKRHDEPLEEVLIRRVADHG